MKKSTFFAGLSALVVPLFLGAQCGGGSTPTQPKEKIAVTSPVSGQKVIADDTLLISWTQSVANAKVSYNYNQGSGWVEFGSVTKIDDKSVKAILPTSSYTDSFQVKVEDNGGTYDPGMSAFFSMKYIVITSPAGGPGQVLHVGDTIPIMWKCYIPKFSSLLIALSTDNGITAPADLVGNSVDPSSGTFKWIIGAEHGSGAPFGYPSSTCILKIQDYVKVNYNDEIGPFSVQQ